MKGWQVALGCVVWFGMAWNAYAKEIVLKNGDRISGTVVAETDRTVTVATEAMGRVTIRKSYIRPSAVPAAKAVAPVRNAGAVVYTRKVAVGYNQTGGNTDTRQGSVGLKLNRKTGHDEWTGEARAFYSSTSHKMDAQKLYGLLRYAYSFGERLKWYQFYKVEAGHDRFADVDYRITPSVGVGYWFSDHDPFKAMVEAGVGFEHTNYRDGTKNTNEPVLVPRAFVEKKFFGKLKLSQEVIYYPSLKTASDYRLHSETALINPITDKLDLRFSLMDDYNATPPEGIKKNDYRLITSLDYAF